MVCTSEGTSHPRGPHDHEKPVKANALLATHTACTTKHMHEGTRRPIYAELYDKSDMHTGQMDRAYGQTNRQAGQKDRHN